MQLPHPTNSGSSLFRGLDRHRLRLTTVAAVVLASAAAVIGMLGALAAPASAAQQSGDSNWAGYVSSGRDTHFTSVSATWRQPAVSCAVGRATYMSSWIGLGGDTSHAVEQIGTEADCGVDGTATYSSWFELYPTVSGDPHVAIRPGDVVSAEVTVSGGDVRLSMTNQTLGTRFSRRLHADHLDVSSAEWIVEAPSVCPTADPAGCGDSVLSDFGSTRFTRARASAAGRKGTVTGPGWTTTPYALATGGAPTGVAPNAGPRAMESAQRGSRAGVGALSANHDAFGIVFAGGE